MSLINQVLNRLEQRGAHTSSDQPQIRAVPSSPRPAWVRLVAIGVSFIMLLAGGIWGLSHRKTQGSPEIRGSITVPVVVAAADEHGRESVAGPATRLSYELSVLPPPASPTSPQPEPSSAVKQDRTLLATSKVEPRSKKEAVRNLPVVMDQEPPPPIKQVSLTQRVEAEYHKGVQLQQQGRIPEAMAVYEAVLKADAQHEAARLAMAGLLQENGQQASAERVLQAGLQQKPVHASFAIAVARMQLERDRLDQAVSTLQAYLEAAEGNADYQAFFAALMQRQSRHEEAIRHFQLALQIAPRSGVWRVGYAISLQTLGRSEEAKLAYQQALATHTLSPEMTAFVQQKLSGL